jgi:small nuclear ribonucleoprotein (snRNP)-like protein
MDLRSEINQLAARRREVVVGLADGSVLRGRLTSVGAQDDAVAFEASFVAGPAKPFVSKGIILSIRNICWIETT